MMPSKTLQNNDSKNFLRDVSYNISDRIDFVQKRTIIIHETIVKHHLNNINDDILKSSILINTTLIFFHVLQNDIQFDS